MAPPTTVKISRSDIPGLDKIMSSSSDTNKTPGLIGITDLAQTAWEYLSESHIGKVLNRFIYKLQNGDLKTIVIVSTTIVVGVMLAYRFLLEDQNEDHSSGEHGKKKEKEEEKDPLRDFTVEQLVSSRLILLECF